MTINEEKKAIENWQKCKFVHPLTCSFRISKIKKCDGILEPEIIHDLEGIKRIFLICPKCKYMQEYVPEIVYQLDYKQFGILQQLINNARNNMEIK